MEKWLFHVRGEIIKKERTAFGRSFFLPKVLVFWSALKRLEHQFVCLQVGVWFITNLQFTCNKLHDVSNPNSIGVHGGFSSIVRQPNWTLMVIIFSAYLGSLVRVVPVSTNKVTANAEPKNTHGNTPNVRVNLSQMAGKLSRKGKPAYKDEALAKDILSLDPTDPNDAFTWGKAKVSLVDANGESRDEAQINKEKMKHRQRAFSVAKQLQIEIRVIWMVDGQMVIALKNDK